MSQSSGTSWTPTSRAAVFLLATSSIACLLADFYRLCPMRYFTAFVFLPALLALGAFAVLNRSRNDGRVCSAICLGLLAGLLAAVAYDIFRLPFVFAKEWGIDSVFPALNLFKVFPRFGAMVLGQPLEQPSYSLAIQLVGWGYHFSNGATFGLMYLALIGDARRRAWGWAVPFALVLELGMLLTPYPRIFNIPLTPHFILVTLAAHAVFGVVLGLSIRTFARLSVPAAPA